jgi:hypothetical protein
VGHQVALVYELKRRPYSGRPQSLRGGSSRPNGGVLNSPSPSPANPRDAHSAEDYNLSLIAEGEEGSEWAPQREIVEAGVRKLLFGRVSAHSIGVPFPRPDVRSLQFCRPDTIKQARYRLDSSNARR